ncbi:hypothetical protein [Ahrensia sp. R2A130]|uniref:hypothetical protein n=1 Tax=Ahrensia sp. R2A130 TaxID=744979 RepID=UPI0001E0B50E|nr:hypothetical protein [Ahrensia sp. R2A130]EFL88284.1 hypothetical protein R2A130_3451 [Ahrensia sp. R2A130]
MARDIRIRRAAETVAVDQGDHLPVFEIPLSKASEFALQLASMAMPDAEVDFDLSIRTPFFTLDSPQIALEPTADGRFVLILGHDQLPPMRFIVTRETLQSIVASSTAPSSEQN